MGWPRARPAPETVAAWSWHEEWCSAYWCRRGWRFDLGFPANMRPETWAAVLERHGWEFLPARGPRFTWDGTSGWYCPAHIEWAKRRRTGAAA